MAGEQPDWRKKLYEEGGTLPDGAFNRLADADLRIARLPPGRVKDSLNEWLGQIARTLAENPKPRAESSPGVQEPGPRRIGLVLVHGMGEQEPGETVTKFAHSFRDSFNQTLPEAKIRVEVLQDGASRVRAISVDGQVIMLYEAYWARQISKEAAEGSFQIETMRQLAWFPWLNLSAGSSLYVSGKYPRWLALWWTALLVTLSGMLYFLSMGLEILGGLLERNAGRKARIDAARKAEQEKGQATENRLKRWTVGFGREMFVVVKESPDASRQWMEKKLDATFGDVINYVNSSVSASRQESGPTGDVGRRIVTQFYRALNHAWLDGCTEIQVIAHSLGSVIAYHGLIDYNKLAGATESADAEESPRITRIYTIGSPLEKIRFLWPKLTREGPLGRVDRVRLVNGNPSVLADGSQQGNAQQLPQQLQWDNFHNPFDIVSGKLTRFDHAVKVKNHSCRGASGILCAHVNYEKDPGFLAVISEGLLGKAYRPDVATATRAWNAISSLGQNFGFILFLVVAALIGLAGVVGVTWGLGVGIVFAFKQSFQWFLPLVGGVVVALLAWVIPSLLALNSAIKIHDKLWTHEADPPEEQLGQTESASDAT